jgi:hypothetical protein
MRLARRREFDHQNDAIVPMSGGLVVSEAGGGSE